MKQIGIIGGGQLAWMMADAAQKLDVELVVQTPSSDDPAVAIAHSTIFASVDDAEATARLATQCEAITFENEFVNLAALSVLAKQGVCFRPSLTTLAPLLDKYHQRCYLRDIGLPVPRFVAVGVGDSLGFQPQGEGFLSQFGFPVVLKARRHGYDGQGTFIIKNIDEFPVIDQETQYLLEEFVPFEKELAIVAARSVSGEVKTYPIVETQQESQVCRRVFVPANLTSKLTAQIEVIAHTLLNSLQAVGIFGIELFLSQDKVLVNEIAPRTHNSGHFSLDAAVTSQFEQHLRAVCGLPLGNPALNCDAAVMVNLLGYENSHSDYQAKRLSLAQIPQAHLHWYGKTESRPGRKLGHVTVLLKQPFPQAQLMAIAREVESIWYGKIQS